MALSHYLRRPVVILDLLALVVCIAGIIHIHQKAGLGVDLKEGPRIILVDRVTDVHTDSVLRAGDRLVGIAGQTLANVEDVEFLLDTHHIGETVPCLVERNAALTLVHVPLVPYYGVSYLVIVILVAGLFYLTAVFVRFRRPDDAAARMYHAGSLGTAVMLSTTWGHVGPPPEVMGIVLRMIFSLAYVFVPAFFFHFIRLFPQPRGLEAGRMVQAGLYVMAAALGAASAYSFLIAARTGQVTDFHTHLALFTLTRYFLIALVFSGLIGIRYSYIHAGEEPERRRLRWVVMGLFVGFIPFIALWVIPSIVLSYALVPEEVMLFASGAIPVAFGISIIRYHIMDIDFLLGRSVVYTIVMGVLILLYAVVVGGAATLASQMAHETSALVPAVAAILMALSFEPLRRGVQNVVDRRYFRVRYNFRREGRRLLEGITRSLSLDTLAAGIIHDLPQVIPVEKMGLLHVGSDRRSFEVLACSGCSGNDLPAVVEELWAGERSLLASAEYLEPGIPFAPMPQPVKTQWGLVLAIPLLARDDASLLGMLVCGPKRAGTRFSTEDVDLLTTVCASIGMEIERIGLTQAFLALQQAEERLKVLNAMKSDFVSYVSHDLRTPLTSIKMYAELLQAKLPRRDRKGKDYLGVIQGEADRLNRMVTTILDSARIEKGAVQYTMRETDLRNVVHSVVKPMTYQVRKEGFTVKLELPRGRGPLKAWADPDAVNEALINLLTNAMKYSPDDRRITIAVRRSATGVCLSVRDRGMGIRPEVMPHLFDKFYRDPALPGRVQGVGIGLSVVKHIMDAHGGTVEVKSRPGEGSEFILTFPVNSAHQGALKHEARTRRRG
jgi:signal transduction histidine kinase